VTRPLVVALACTVALGAGASRSDAELSVPARDAAQAPRLGILYGPSATLVRVEPATLRVLPGPRLDVGNHTYAWSFSADRTRLALGGDWSDRGVPELLVVDAVGLRELERLPVAPRGWLRGTRWLPGGRVLAVVDGWDAGTIVATVDVGRRRVAARRTLEGAPLHVVPTRDGMAILLAARDRIGPARLAVVRPSGEIDVVSLERMLAGSRPTGSATRAEFRSVTPALAVDRVGDRAFVVGAGDSLAEVDLGTLAVTSRRVSRPRSLLGRLAAWLQPAAQAKSVEGPTRHAQWLGGGLLAVSGGDYASVSGRPRATTFRGAGVRLIDTRSWTTRSVAPGADFFRVAGGLVLGIGATWSSELVGLRPIGLSVYRLDGRKRFQLYRGTRVWLVHADARRAFIDRAGPGGAEVVDLATGRVVAKRASIPAPLVGDASIESG
jgi:hypothetical protein